MRRYFFGLAMMALAMLAPTIVRADDTQIARQIIERLQVEKKAGNLKGFSIDLQVDEGTVWMSGKLASEEQRFKALDIARRVPGVKQVVNDLKVAGAETARSKASRPAEQSPDFSVATEESSAKPTKSMLSALKPTLWTSRRDKAEQKPASDEADDDAEEPAIPAIKKVSTEIGTGVNAQASKVQAAAAPYYAPTPRPLPEQVMPAQTYAQQAPSRPQAVAVSRSSGPVPMASSSMAYRQAQYEGQVIHDGDGGGGGAPAPMYGGAAYGMGAARYDHPQMPSYSWPSYASYPNYAAVTYPKQYSPTAWPYIGPFYPYPQVPMGWRKVELQWDDGWWFLDFKESRKVSHGRWDR